jgi:WD40 repeat protein
MPIENISPLTGTIALFGTLVGILAGSFQVLDQIEKRRAQWSNKRKLNKANQELLVSSEKSNSNNVAFVTNTRQDWGDAVDVSVFYGRTEELAELEQWILQDGCRLVALLGMGGIGKTSLSIKIAQHIAETGSFAFVIWRSLGNAPPIQEVLTDFIKFLSLEQVTELPYDINAKISLLIDYLRSSRCLLILDNFESILNEGDKVGEYREGYEYYGELLKKIGTVSHNSCLIITSREKPKEIVSLERDNLAARSLQINGLKAQEGEEIFYERGLSGTDGERSQVIDSYQGNPLALKIISTTIQELFHGSISEFLAQQSIVFGEIRDLLEGQFNRLSDLEREVMYWLAINREPVTISELREDIVSLSSSTNLIEALESLVRRYLIEKAKDTVNRVSTFTLHNVVMEYMTDYLIQQVSDEINQGVFKLFNSHALMKATANDYIRSSQIRLILEPIIYRLTPEQRRNGEYLLEVLKKSELSAGYAAGNIINLLVYLKIDLRNYDFSYLTIKQVYIQGVSLQAVNFAHAEFEKSIFTQPFGSILSVAFSPSGEMFAAGDANGRILIWQVADTKQVLSCKGHLSWISSVTFNLQVTEEHLPMLASSSSDQTVRLWNINECGHLKTFEGHTNEVQSVAFSPNGKNVASGSSDQTIRVWDIKTGDCIKILQGHTNVVRAIAYSPDGKILASGSSDYTIRLWDVDRGICVKVLEGHTAWVRSVVFCIPDDRELSLLLISCSDDKTIRFWDVSTGICIEVLEEQINQVRAIAISDNYQLLSSGGRDLTIKIWDISTREHIKTLRGHTQSIESIAFSPNSKMLVSGSYDQTVRLWDVDEGKCLKTLQGYANWVWTVAFSPIIPETGEIGGILASGSDDFAVRLWDVNSGECLQILAKHTNRVWCVVFSPNGKLLASSSDDKSIRLWEIATGECVKTFWENTYRIKSICFSPDGAILASTSADETIKIWDVNEGKCLKILEANQERVQSVAFSPDGNILVSGGDDWTVRLWSVSTGECIKVLKGHTAEVNSVTFSHDGQIIASGSNDHDVRIWLASTGECIQVLQGHTHAVHSVAFSPHLAAGSTWSTLGDSSSLMLFSSGTDETIRIWNVATGECLKTLQEHLGTVWSVSVSPISAIVASGSQDETIKLWDANTGECLRTIRAKRPYEGMNITGVKGLTEVTIGTLLALGAVEE